MLKGIDISMHNGSINFEVIKNSGISTVIIKATEGVDYVDSYLNQHYNGAKSQAMNIGFYHFMSEKTSPSQQAIDFWNSIKGKQFNILPCLDIETNSMGRDKTQISDRCIEFLSKFKSLSGLNCMIYTGGYFGRDNLDSRVKNYPGWIAHYGVDSPMTTGFTVVGHQYTEDGHINGVNTRVDLNNFADSIFIGKATNAVETKEIKIQKMLVAIGYPVGSSGIDGIIGSGTITAIKAFQKDCNLTIDGDVGSKTWHKLVYEYNKKLGVKPTQEEEFDMGKVVLYFGPLDALSAVLVSQKHQCAMMLKKDFENKKLKAKEIIIIGGKPGTDRYDSFKNAAKLV